MTYSVALTVWSNGVTYTQTITQGDDTPGNVTPVYGLADPLVITQQLATGDLMPQGQPSPDECSFNLIAPDATTYQALAVGDPLEVLVYSQAALAGNVTAFRGRVASLQASPHDLGVMYAVTCLDYTADLRELLCGLTDWPIEEPLPRVTRIMAEAGLAWVSGATPAWVALGGSLRTVSPRLAARTKSPTDVYSALAETLTSQGTLMVVDEVAVSLPGVDVLQQAAWFAPRITSGQLDPTTPWVISRGLPWTKRCRYAPPARLSNLAGVRTITVAAADSSPSTGAPIVDAGNVDVGATFAQEKGSGLASRITTSDASGRNFTWDWFASYSADALVTSLPVLLGTVPNQVTVAQNIGLPIDATDASFGGSGQATDWRVPFRPDPKAGWSLPTLTWQVWNEPNFRRPDLTELFTVARALTAKAPPNREWVTGQVVGTRLTVANGRPVVDITLYPSTLDYAVQASQQGPSLGVCRLDSPVLGSVTRTNLSQDPSFESGSTRGGWLANAGGTVVKSTTVAHDRTTSLKVTTTVDNWGYFPMDGSVNGGTTTPNRVIGQVYTASVWVFLDTAQTVWLRQYGTNAVNGASTAVVANTWTRLSVTWTAGTTVFLSVRRTDATALLGIMYLDQWMVETGASLGAYFDGATAAAPPLSYAWTGTADASPSTEATAVTLAALSPRDTFADYQIVRGS